MPKDPLRYHRKHRNKGLIGDHWSEKVVAAVAQGIGTTAFLVIALGLIIGWVIINGGYGFFSGAFTRIAAGQPFDPAPWILLNLIFSFEAFFTGSLVVIAAKAQAKRELAREEADAKHREELAHDQLQRIGENTLITEAIRDLTNELHAHFLGPKPPTEGDGDAPGEDLPAPIEKDPRRAGA